MFNSNNPYSNNLPNNAYNANNQYRYGPFNPVPGPYRRPRSQGPLGCLRLLVVAALLSAGAIFLLNNHPNYILPPFLEQLPFPVLLLGAFGMLFVLIFLQKIFRRTLLGRFIGSIASIFILAMIATTLYWVFFINPYVGMTSTGFMRTSVGISSGDTLHFQNPVHGVTQVLCSGTNQRCQTEGGAPKALQQGIRVLPGQTVDIKFDTDGSYHITSKTTPNMNLTITVSAPSDSSD